MVHTQLPVEWGVEMNTNGGRGTHLNKYIPFFFHLLAHRMFYTRHTTQKYLISNSWTTCECGSLKVASNLHQQLSMGLCHGQGFHLIAFPPSHSPQYHNGLAPSTWHKCFSCLMLRWDSWSTNEDSQYLRPQFPASKTLSQSKLWHRAVKDPCADNNSVPHYQLLSSHISTKRSQ